MNIESLVATRLDLQNLFCMIERRYLGLQINLVSSEVSRRPSYYSRHLALCFEQLDMASFAQDSILFELAIEDYVYFHTICLALMAKVHFPQRARHR